MTAQVRDTDRIGLGIAAIVGAVLLFSITDAIAKLLGMANYSATQIAFFRYLFGLIPVAIMVWSAGAGALKTRRPLAHALRAAFLFCALLSLFTGLRSVPLAEAISILLTAPLFITALSNPVLGERVGPRRWIAVILGFVGGLIALRPGTAAFQLDALWLVASAFLFASAMLLTRKMSITETSAAMFTYTTVGAFVVCIPFAASTWAPVADGVLWLFLAIGVVGGCAAYLMIVAYRSAPAALVAPFEYTALVWGAVIGWLVWAEVPAVAVWLGAGLIVACGIYLTRRESVPAGLE